MAPAIRGHKASSARLSPPPTHSKNEGWEGGGVPSTCWKAPAGPRPILFHFPHNRVPPSPGTIYSPQPAIVCGDFKLIHFAETNKYELYNLRDDISERHDLSQEQPEKLQEMINLLNAALKDKSALPPRRK
ncbi:MAG: hypothetical protein MJ056_02140 [Akkermansia sp.]|nr:hypothetical protein [Akkermansia sp.]